MLPNATPHSLPEPQQPGTVPLTPPQSLSDLFDPFGSSDLCGSTAPVAGVRNQPEAYVAQRPAATATQVDAGDRPEKGQMLEGSRQGPYEENRVETKGERKARLKREKNKRNQHAFRERCRVRILCV